MAFGTKLRIVSEVNTTESPEKNKKKARDKTVAHLALTHKNWAWFNSAIQDKIWMWLLNDYLIHRIHSE